MNLSAQDVREVRFGTTRVRAGYDMKEVDAFLDTVEAAIARYAGEHQQARDEVSALRSQVGQLQSRLAAVQSELEQCQSASVPASSAQHDTVVTQLPQASPAADLESTAETPVVAESSVVRYERLVRVRDDVRAMLNEQLALVDRLDIDSHSG